MKAGRRATAEAAPRQEPPLTLADIRIKTPAGGVYAGQALANLLLHVGAGEELAARLHGVVEILKADVDEDANLVVLEFLRSLADQVYATDQPDSVTGNGSEGYARHCRVEIVRPGEVAPKAGA